MYFSEASNASIHRLSICDIRDKMEFLELNSQEDFKARLWALISVNHSYGESLTDKINIDEFNKEVDELIKLYPGSIKRIKEYSDHYVLVRIYKRNAVAKDTTPAFDCIYELLKYTGDGYCLDDDRLYHEECEAQEEWLLSEVKNKLREGIDHDKAIWQIKHW